MLSSRFTGDPLPKGVNLLPVFKAFGTFIQRDVKRACRQKGGRHFWSEIADATRVVEVTEQGVRIENRHIAAAQKQYGGAIAAKNAAALTIPLTGDAKGRRAGEFTDLVKVRTDDGKTILGRTVGKKKTFQALFVLVKRTKPQAPEPFWPTQQEAIKHLEHSKSLARLV